MILDESTSHPVHLVQCPTFAFLFVFVQLSLNIYASQHAAVTRRNCVHDRSIHTDTTNPQIEAGSRIQAGTQIQAGGVI